ncbi:MAG: phosphotransferase [Gammaproteobacteria bacterium]
MIPPTLEEILNQWREFDLPFSHQPRIVRIFSNGRSNKSALLSADSAQWVLRVGNQTAGLGVSRERELVIHKAVAAVGLAPKITFASQRHDFWISEYIDGNHLSTLAANDLRDLISALEKISELRFDLPRFDYRQQLLRLNGNTALPAHLNQALEKLESNGTTGLCHHDLNPGNIIFIENHPIFLDWEYAAIGCKEIDFASIAVEWQVSQQQICSNAGIDLGLLNSAVTVYEAMCKYWEAAVSKCGNR